jgi:diguanylate cyclase (GGDEF)-like protein/PAS domain S-box-containing protein
MFSGRFHSTPGADVPMTRGTEEGTVAPSRRQGDETTDPRHLLTRFRRLFALFTVVTALSLPLQLSLVPGAHSRVIAVVAVATVVGWSVVVFRTGGRWWWFDLTIAGPLYVLATAFPSRMVIYPLFFVLLFQRALDGSFVRAYAGAMVVYGTWEVAGITNGEFTVDGATLATACGVVFATMVLRGVRVLTQRSSRAARRDLALHDSARALLGADDRASVIEEVARAGAALAEQDGAACEVWEERGDGWHVVAAHGQLRNERIAADRLPAIATDGFVAGEPWVLGREEARALQAALGVPALYDSYLIAPFPRDQGPRAAVVLCCPKEPDEDLLGLFRRYVTEAVLAEDRAVLLARLAEREARLSSIINHSSDVIAGLDAEGRFTMINRSGEVRFGHRSKDVVGRSVYDLIHPADQATVAAALADEHGSSGLPINCRLATADGRWRHVESYLTAQGGGAEGYVLNVRDVTDRKALEAEIIHQAFHDPLTKLANRALFTDRLVHALDRSKRTGEPVAVLLVDLDDFKPINDTYGHQAGDTVLVELADRLRTEVRESDTAARLGGDEFAVIVEDASDVAGLAALASRLQVAMSGPVLLGPLDVCTVGVSIGVARSSVSSTPDTVIRRADEALYEVKFSGKGRVGFADRDPGPVISGEMDPVRQGPPPAPASDQPPDQGPRSLDRIAART